MVRHGLWILLLTASCAPVGGPVTVEALVPDDDARGDVVLGDVTLDTVTDLQRGRGSDFDVRGGVVLNGSDMIGLEAMSYEDMLELLRGNGGVDIDARMSGDGERYVADDYETLFYFSMFANFEQAFTYARAAGDDSDATNVKSLVGMFAVVQLAELLPLPLLSSDNAAFVGPLDGWLVLRTGLQDGVPFGMSRAVISHEFGHRLFFQNVFRSVDGGFELWRETLDADNSTGFAAVRQQNLFRGTDEGLADVFAMGAMADASAIGDAFSNAGVVFAPEGDRRDVEGPFAEAATYDNLKDLTLDASLLTECGLSATDFAERFNFDCIGTVVATTVWAASGRDIEQLQTVLQPALIRAMPQVGEALVQGVDYDLDLLWQALAGELAPGAERNALCAAVSVRFTSLVATGRIPACS